MPAIQRLPPADAIFPPTDRALDDPNGLLAVGGDLSCQRLLVAYRAGIFPWFEPGQPIMWWSPDPRSVLFPDEFHVSRSLQRTLRRNHYLLSVDRAFEAVMRACAAPRRGQAGTWIGEDMINAYCNLHQLGYAHSVEVWDPDQELVGGIYGISMGQAFFGESMFSTRSDASKVALCGLVQIMRQAGIKLLDCQVESDHLNSLGARNISRLDFEAWLRQTIAEKLPRDCWVLPQSSGALE